MSNSHEQILNETQLTASSPDFLYCEAERYCLESLVSSGSDAFYTKLSSEHIGAFLSPGEVKEISSWVENFQDSDAVLENEHGEEDVCSDVQSLSGHYFPEQSDTSAPCLELGWPERNNWMDMNQVNVYTNPPAEGYPSIRKVLRRLLQGATKLIAVVTERLSDCAVIDDLQCAASRRVPVYIILNRRSVEQNCFPQQLQHANIRVRVLEGKRFLSRDMRSVVGELKDSFVLVDLETVMLGSYSLTWTDTHLHRQIVTVLSGPVVQSFDHEFRILYAASLPIPDAWLTTKPVTESHCKPEPLKLNSTKIELSEFVSSPPPPHSDSPLDWEAMGVIQRFPDSPVHLPEVGELQIQHQPLVGRRPWDFSFNEFNNRVMSGHHEEGKLRSDLRHPEYQRSRRLFSPGFQIPHANVNRPIQVPVRDPYKLLSLTADKEERFPIYKPRSHRTHMSSEDEIRPTIRREPFFRRDRVLGEAMNSEGTKQANLKKPSELSRSQTFSTLSEILKRVNTENPAAGVSKSTLDLQHTEATSNTRIPNCDNSPLTPALALMKTRNEEIKPGFLRGIPNVFAPNIRSSGFGLQRETRRSHFKSCRSFEEQ